MTLLCLHGNSSSKRVFEPLKEYLPDNIEVIAPDFPGQGDSPHTGKINYSWAKLKQTVIDAAKKAEDDIILYGNSLGGHIAIDVLPEIPQCKGLIISGTPPLRKPIVLEEVFTLHPAMNILFMPDASKEELEKNFGILSYSENEKNILIEDYLRTDPKAREAHAENAADTDAIADEVKILNESDVPAMILEGDKDILIRPEYLERISKECGIEHLRINGGGHYVSLQMPERVANEIMAFIERYVL